MKNFALALLLFSASCMPARANDLVMRAGPDASGTEVMLFSAPCVNARAASMLPQLNIILATGGVPPVDEKDLQKASVLHRGKIYEACWVLVLDTVAVMDEAADDTSLFPVPLAAFRKVNAI